MTTLEQFVGYMKTLHEMGVANPNVTTSATDGTMYNCVRQLGCNVFAYSYDALCTEILRFNEDGSIDEWADARDDDWKHYEPHFTYEGTEEWFRDQIVAISTPVE